MRVFVEAARNQESCAIIDGLKQTIPGAFAQNPLRGQNDELWVSQQVELILANHIGFGADETIERPNAILLRFQSEVVERGKLQGLRKDNRCLRLNKRGCIPLGPLCKLAHLSHRVLPDFGRAVATLDPEVNLPCPIPRQRSTRTAGKTIGPLLLDQREACDFVVMPLTVWQNNRLIARFADNIWNSGHLGGQ